MSFNFSNIANHADSASAPIGGAPCAMSVWVKIAAYIQFHHFMTLVKSGDNTNFLGIITSPQSASGNAGVEAFNGVTGQSVLENNPLPLNAWVHLIGLFPLATSRNIVQNGTVFGPGGAGSIVPTGINSITLSGRQGDHGQNANGLMAHAALFGGRAPTNIECAYIGTGGNVRAVGGLVGYWKLNRTTSAGLVIPDELGVTPLNVTGAMAAGADDPATATWMVNGPAINQLFKQGVPVSLNLGALFDGVSSPYTCSIVQLGVAAQVTTAPSAAATPATETVLASAAAFAAGDYIQLGVGGTPTQVLYVVPGTATVLWDTPVTWAANAPVFRIPVVARPIPGATVTANVLGGTPTTAANYSNCIIRAVCNANAALIADSNPITITVSTTLPATTTRQRHKRRIFVKGFYRR